MHYLKILFNKFKPLMLPMTEDRNHIINEPPVFIPNFNDAALSMVIFHKAQSIPLLRYDFKKSDYNFDQGLLAGMISAILTVSEEIDQHHKSLLRKIDQTSYTITVSMGRKVGVLLFAQREENEQILREFTNYILAEFERQYKDVLTNDLNFEENMFDDFIPTIKRTALVPVALSPDMIMDIVPVIKKYASNFSVLICDKLIFMPVFKQLSDYITPSELQHIRTFLKEIVLGSIKFLDQVQKYGSMDVVQFKTSKKTFFIKSLDPFYFIIIAKKAVTLSEISNILDMIDDIVFKNSLVLTTGQKAWLFKNIEEIKQEVPELADTDTFQEQVLIGLKQFQRENKLLLRATEQFSSHERRKTIKNLLDFLFDRLIKYFDNIEQIEEKLLPLKKKMMDGYETRIY